MSVTHTLVRASHALGSRPKYILRTLENDDFTIRFYVNKRVHYVSGVYCSSFYDRVTRTLDDRRVNNKNKVHETPSVLHS